MGEYNERMLGLFLGLTLVAIILGSFLALIIWLKKRYESKHKPPKKKPDFFCEATQPGYIGGERCIEQCIWCRTE